MSLRKSQHRPAIDRCRDFDWGGESWRSAIPQDALGSLFLAQIIAEYCLRALTLAEEGQAPSQWNGRYMEAGLRRRLTLLANCHFRF